MEEKHAKNKSENWKEEYNNLEENSIIWYILIFFLKYGNNEYEKGKKFESKGRFPKFSLLFRNMEGSTQVEKKLFGSQLILLYKIQKKGRITVTQNVS